MFFVYIAVFTIKILSELNPCQIQRSCMKICSMIESPAVLLVSTLPCQKYCNIDTHITQETNNYMKMSAVLMNM